MPWLATRVPLAVPIPEVVTASPLVVRHLLVPGEPLETPVAEQGRSLGEFLHALHACPVAKAAGFGFPGADRTLRARAADDRRFRAEVIPLVPQAYRARALAVLDAVREFPADTVVHGDIGPEHVLAEGARVTGVIDFGDVHLGDEAIDLAWALFGTPAAFADAVAQAYGVTDAVRARAQVWHRLGPWHQVLYGADIGDPVVAKEGLAGVIERLS